MGDVTQIIKQIYGIDDRDPSAVEQLLPLVYDELRKLAAQRMMAERSDHTLQATALVHEAYLRLIGTDDGEHWDNRGHFFAAAAEAMRRILIENARRRRSAKRGAGWQKVELDDSHIPAPITSDNVLSVDAAISRLREDDPLAAELVTLRYFAGLPLKEAAEIVGVSRATACRYWAYAKAFLICELEDEAGPEILSDSWKL